MKKYTKIKIKLKKTAKKLQYRNLGTPETTIPFSKIVKKSRKKAKNRLLSIRLASVLSSTSREIRTPPVGLAVPAP